MFDNIFLRKGFFIGIQNLLKLVKNSVGSIITETVFSESAGEMVTASNGKYRVTVIKERCKECGICIMLCPTNVLEKGTQINNKGYRYTVPVNINACIGCHLCEINCPDFAVFVTEVRNAES